MRSYTLAALVSSFAGWLAATVIYAIGYFIVDEKQALIAISIIAPITFIISILANIIFVQLPRYLIKKAFFRIGRLGFALTYSVLAFISLSLTFGPRGSAPVEQLANLNAIANGFALGFVFYSIWKPVD